MSGCIVISCWENYIMIILYTYRTLNMLNSFKHQSNLGTFSSLKKKLWKNFQKPEVQQEFVQDHPSMHFHQLIQFGITGVKDLCQLSQGGRTGRLSVTGALSTLDHSAERRKLKNTALIAVIKFEVNKTIKIQDRKKLIGKWRFLKLEADSSSPLLWSICSASCTNWFILVLDPKSIIFTSQPACHAPALPLTCSLERKYCTLLGSPHGKSKTVIQYKFC